MTNHKEGRMRLLMRVSFLVAVIILGCKVVNVEPPTKKTPKVKVVSDTTIVSCDLGFSPFSAMIMDRGENQRKSKCDSLRVFVDSLDKASMAVVRH